MLVHFIIITCALSISSSYGVIFVQWKKVEMSIFVVIVPSDESAETDGFDEAVESAQFGEAGCDNV